MVGGQKAALKLRAVSLPIAWRIQVMMDVIMIADSLFVVCRTGSQEDTRRGSSESIWPGQSY